MAETDIELAPIDVNKLVQFSYNCDPLKEALIYLIEQVHENSISIKYLKEKAGEHE